MGRGQRSSREQFTLVDLFCGAGGLSLGFSRAGFKSLLALDHFAAAVRTYRENLGDHVREAEIGLDTELPTSSIIIGGPPCQGFSSAGLRKVGDKRNTLVSVFAKLIAANKPTAFVFENVEGFLTGESGERVFDLLRPLVEAGYRIHVRKVNVANYGVAQHRKRVVAIGGLGWDPSFPNPTHTAFGAPGAHLIGGLPRTPTITEALAGLPRPSLEEPGVPQGHWDGPLSPDDAERVAALGPGQTMRDLPERFWHESFKRRAFRRVMDGTPTERRGGAPCGIRRLRPDEPSKAITGGARSEFVHPTENRYLTLRECARIQGFPDDFRFLGTQAEQALLIGNAVPPVFGEALAVSIREQLASRKVSSLPGKLLSFVPTMSSGMSPALRSLTDRVTAEFGVQLVPAEEQMRLWA